MVVEWSTTELFASVTRVQGPMATRQTGPYACAELPALPAGADVAPYHEHRRRPG